MYQPDPDRPVFENTRKAIEFIVGLDASLYSRKTELGQLSFDDSPKIIEAVKSLFSDLDPARLVLLPPDILQLIIDQTALLSSVLDSISAFSLALGQGVNDRSNIQNQLISIKDHFIKSLLPYIAYFIASNSGGVERSDQLNLEFKAFQFTAEQAKNSIEQQLEDARQIVEAMRSQSAELGIATEAKNFKDAADKHENKAKLWVVLTAVALAISIIMTVASLLWSHKNLESANNFVIANFITTKFIILGICFYAINLSGWNFMSHKHNEEVNRHRMKALQTYKSFVEGVSDSNVKDAILSHAANAVFAPQDTGFIKGQELPQTNQMLDFVSRAATAAPKP